MSEQKYLVGGKKITIKEWKQAIQDAIDEALKYQDIPTMTDDGKFFLGWDVSFGEIDEA